MKIRSVQADLPLDRDVAEGLERVNENGEDGREIANQLLRDYLTRRKILPIRQEE